MNRESRHFGVVLADSLDVEGLSLFDPIEMSFCVRGLIRVRDSIVWPVKPLIWQCVGSVTHVATVNVNFKAARMRGGN